MDKSTLIASLITVGIVVGCVIFRLLWLASATAAAAGLGRLPILPKTWRRWLFGERNDASC